MEAQWAASRQNGTPFISLQPRYSLLAREIEADVLPACERQGLGTLIYSPLAGGMLSGKYRQGEPLPPHSRYASRPHFGVFTERNFEIVEAVKAIAAQLDTTPSAVAIAWCLTRRGVTSAIIGPRMLEQMNACLEGMDLTLPDEALKALSDVSRPGDRR